MEETDTLNEIYKWIDAIPLSRPKRNIARDFSDAVLMAELLKKYYPRNVDLHNYISGNSISKKIDNWSTLNRKVLSRIGIKLGKDVIDKLAHSEPGIIETVLLNLRNKIIKNSYANHESMCSSFEENSNGESGCSIIGTSEEMRKKAVSKQTFMKLKQELQKKNQMAESLKERINHLERILKLKDERIIDLESRCRIQVN